MNLVLMVAGSVAAYKAAELASSLVKADHQVQVVMTAAAHHFIGSTTFEALTGRAVMTDPWAAGQGMAHIELRRWADLYVVYPATANRLNSLAAGLSDDLVGSTFLANNAAKPFWLAPAMNPQMLGHPATQASLKTLESWGYPIFWGDQGRMACGDYGIGRLIEPAEMFDQIQAEAYRQIRQTSNRVERRVLITGGAMTEPIDQVRAITNRSTGRTAGQIVRTFLSQGWLVDYVHHDTADLSGTAGANRQVYQTFADLQSILIERLSNQSYQAAVHAAAVSDYLVADQRLSKIDSQEDFNLTLQPHPKLLTQIRQVTAKQAQPAVICAFKFTAGADESSGQASVDKIFRANQADLVVWNDASTYHGDQHNFALWTSTGLVGRGQTSQELAAAVFSAISREVDQR